jgi:hypothetical protein
MKFAHDTPPFLSPSPLFPFHDIIPPQEMTVLMRIIQKYDKKESLAVEKR